MKLGENIVGRNASTFDYKSIEERKQNVPSVVDTENSLNCKPELEFQWGLGSLSPVYDGTSPNTEAKEALRGKEYKRQVFVARREVGRFIREHLLRGRTAKQIIREVKARFTPETLTMAEPVVKTLMAAHGVIGVAVVDATGFKSCREAVRYAKTNPFKRYFRYVIGCKCGEHNIQASTVDSTPFASGLDAVLAGQIPVQTSTRRMCASTSLDMISSVNDISDEFADGLLMEMAADNNLTAGQVKAIKASGKSNVEKVRLAFLNSVMLRKKDKPQAQTGMRMQNAKMEVVIAKEVEGVDVTKIGLDTKAKKTVKVGSVRSQELDVTQMGLGTVLDRRFKGAGNYDMTSVVGPVAPVDIDPRGELTW